MAIRFVNSSLSNNNLLEHLTVAAISIRIKLPPSRTSSRPIWESFFIGYEKNMDMLVTVSLVILLRKSSETHQ